ncbi:unnamed protein product, partial [Linum tenue]
PFSGSEYNGSAGFLDLPLRSLGHELRLHHDRLVVRQDSLSEHLEVTKLSDINHRRAILSSLVLHLLRNHGPKLVDVDNRAEEPVLQLVEVPHTDLAEVARMVLVEQDPVVVHTSGVTATTRMLAMFADTTVSGADMASLLAVLLEPSGHFSTRRRRKQRRICVICGWGFSCGGKGA